MICRAAVALTVALFAGQIQAASIGLNVGTNMGAGALAGPTDVRQTNWNDAAITIPGSQISWASTVDNGGAATTMTAVLNLTGPNNGTGSLGSGGSDDARMLNTFIDLFNGTSGAPNAVLTVSNVPYDRYSVYVYLQPDDVNRVAGTQIGSRSEYMRMLASGSIPADGSGYIESDHTTAPISGPDALNIPQAHFVKFDALSAGTFTANLWGDLSNNGAQRFRVAGFQIEQTFAIPEPSTALLLGVGLVGLVVRRRRSSQSRQRSVSACSLAIILVCGIVSLLAATSNAATVNKVIDNFTNDTLDPGTWTLADRGLENTGAAGYAGDTTTNNNQLTLFSNPTSTNQFWYGKTLESVDTFSSNIGTTVTVDRVSLSGSGSAYRSSLWLYQPGGQYLHFSQNFGENGWQYNPTNGGGGTNIAAFDAQDGDLGAKQMRLVYIPLGGTNADVEIYLDGVLGATHSFTNWDNSVEFQVFLTGQARASGDSVAAVFDNFFAYNDIAFIPEPSTALLLGIGLVGLMSRRRRTSGHGDNVGCNCRCTASAGIARLSLLIVAALAGSLGLGEEVFANAYTEAVLADAPVAWYRFEESSGSVATDSSLAGANHPGTYNGSFTLGQSSGALGLGKAMDFTPNTSLRIPDHADFDWGTGNMSLEMWYQTDSNSRGDMFTYKGGGGDFGIHSAGQGADSVSFYLNGYNGLASGVAQGDWHHLVVTRDSGTVSIYVDNQLKSTTTDTDTMTIANDLIIGANHTGDPGSLALGFDGRIDEVAFYSYALSATDISAHFFSSTVAPEPSTALLLGVGLVGLVARRRRGLSMRIGGARYVLALALVVACVVFAGTAQAAFLTPISVTANGNVDAGAVADNMINHNGLTTAGTHASAFATQNHWRTTSAANTLTITYDLGAQFNLDSMRVWNYNESGVGGGSQPNTDRGVQNMTVSFSKDNVNFFNSQTVSLSQATGLATYTGEDKTLADLKTGTRYVKFDVLTSHGSNNGFTGLSEVRFNTTNDEIVPVGVTVNQTANGGATFGISNLTDDTGMTGFGNEQSQEANSGNGFIGQWRQSTSGGNVLANSEIKFDLGSDQSIGAVKIWNFHEAGQTDRGIDEFAIYQSDDDTIYSLVGTYNLTQQSGSLTVAHDVIDLNGLNVNAQYLRFNLSSNHGDAGFYGLGEVRFFAAAATIPEPSSLALLGLSLLGLSLRRRRRA
ncbi:MAG: LamG domain-containing protein [Planctomycetales bacterium]|nr:LamG domain-containing protein [Planctomycetales bacterium]